LKFLITVLSASANFLSVTRCNISFGARGFHSAAPGVWNSPPHLTSILANSHNIPPTPKISSFLFRTTNCSASGSFTTIYLVTYINLGFCKQEAQLSQRGFAMFRVIEYFSRSIKVIRNNTLEEGMCESLLVFHCDSIYL